MSALNVSRRSFSARGMSASLLSVNSSDDPGRLVTPEDGEFGGPDFGFAFATAAPYWNRS